jgi:hypothetical protein
MSEEIYTTTMRAHGEMCPICGFWHTSSGCPPQVSAQSARILDLMNESGILRKQLEMAMETLEWYAAGSEGKWKAHNALAEIERVGKESGVNLTVGEEDGKV